jgi:hypothetical protein
LVIPHTTTVQRKPIRVCLCEVISETRRLSSATNPASIVKSVGNKAWRSDEQ